MTGRNLAIHLVCWFSKDVKSSITRSRVVTNVPVSKKMKQNGAIRNNRTAILKMKQEMVGTKEATLNGLIVCNKGPGEASVNNE